jgi:hypothetical protein
MPITLTVKHLTKILGPAQSIPSKTDIICLHIHDDDLDAKEIATMHGLLFLY